MPIRLTPRPVLEIQREYEECLAEAQRAYGRDRSAYEHALAKARIVGERLRAAQASAS